MRCAIYLFYLETRFDGYLNVKKWILSGPILPFSCFQLKSFFNLAASCLDPILRQKQTLTPQDPDNQRYIKLQHATFDFTFLFYTSVVCLIPGLHFQNFDVILRGLSLNLSQALFLPSRRKDASVAVYTLLNITKIYKILSPRVCKAPHLNYVSYTQNHLGFYLENFQSYSRHIEDGEKANAQSSNRFIAQITCLFKLKNTWSTNFSFSVTHPIFNF